MKPRKVKFPFKTRLSLKPLIDFWEACWPRANVVSEP